MISYHDVKDIEQLFKSLSAARLRRVFWRQESLDLAKQVLDRDFSTERQAIDALYAHFNRPEKPKECLCPPANGRRWYSSPVKWGYDPRGEQFPYRNILRDNFARIMAVCGILFEEVQTEAESNIWISNDRLDGAGGTLGIAYQPVTGDRMSACGQMCGNIIIDTAENWNKPFFQTVAMHEQLHAVGLPHNTDRRSIMYFQYQGPREIHQIDIDELLRRYPFARA